MEVIKLWTGVLPDTVSPGFPFCRDANGAISCYDRNPMKKLVKGIVDFRRNALPEYREKFAHLATGQNPDALLIACSDSRVVPNLFASTDPGDLFVVRNVGNLIPCCGKDGHSIADESEAAALEFALLNLNVVDIIVCGHSECGAMKALLDGRKGIGAPNLRDWLRHGEDSLSHLSEPAAGQSRANRLSQLNVVQQLEHLRTYPMIQERVAQGTLKLHGWWFEVSTANVYAHDERTNRFILIDETYSY
jgi:carbonic anhydrase